MNATPPSQSVVSRRRRDGTTLSQHRRQSLSTMCTDTLQLLLSILTSIIDAISSLNTALATTTKHLAKHLLSLLGKLALKALRFTAFSLYKTCVVTKPYVCMAYNAFVQSRGYRFVRETVCFLVAPFGFLRGCGVGLWTRIPERVPLDVWRDKKCKPGQITVRLRFHDGCYNDGLDPRDYDQPCLIDYFTPEKNGELDLRRVAKRFGVEKITVLDLARKQEFQPADPGRLSPLAVTVLSQGIGHITTTEHLTPMIRRRKLYRENFRYFIRDNEVLYLVCKCIMLLLLGYITFMILDTEWRNAGDVGMQVAWVPVYERGRPVYEGGKMVLRPKYIQQSLGARFASMISVW